MRKDGGANEGNIVMAWSEAKRKGRREEGSGVDGTNQTKEREK